jgi:hypothetical protein
MVKTVLVALILTVGLVACGPAGQYTPEQLAAARAQWMAAQEQERVRGEEAWIAMIAEGLQLNPLADPAVRADPYPCARATYHAQQTHTPLPRCYYEAVGRTNAATVAVPVFGLR